MEENRMIKSGRAKAGDWVFVIICVIVCLICVLPMINLLAKSLSSSDALVKHEVYLLPKGINFKAYTTVLKDPKYIKSFFWTVFLTLVCTIVSLTMTAFCAYPLIYEDLKGRGLINIIITVTMFFNAGTIPNYLLMNSLGLLSNPLVLILPSCLSVYNNAKLFLWNTGQPPGIRADRRGIVFQDTDFDIPSAQQAGICDVGSVLCGRSLEWLFGCSYVHEEQGLLSFAAAPL